MKMNILGKTGLSVSTLGFGCAPLGNEYGDLTEDEATRTIHTAIDHGINFFDTSPYYGRTLSESRLGHALRGKRDQVVVATKGGRFDAPLATGFDFSYANIMRMCEDSLQRLQTDVIDVYQLHDIEAGDREVVINEGVRALQDLKQQGKVRFIGVTGFPLEILHDVIEATDLDVTLSYCHYNLVNQRLNDQLVPLVEARQMGLINASVTGMGLLTPQGPQAWHPCSDELKRVAREVAAYCGEQGHHIAHIAIQFALANPHVDVTLLGTRTTEELMSSLSLLEKPLDHGLVEELLRRYRPVLNEEWPSVS